MTDEQNRADLYALIQKHLAGDNEWAADVLTRLQGKRVSPRAVQTWLIAPHRQSHRRCPPWVPAMLRDYVTNPENKPALERDARIRSGDTGPYAEAARFEAQQSVDSATIQLEREELIGDKWRRAVSQPELPRMLTQLEIGTERELASFWWHLDAVVGAIKASGDDAMRKELHDRLKVISLRSFHKNEVLQDLAARRGEFSPDDEPEKGSKKQ